MNKSPLQDAPATPEELADLIARVGREQDRSAFAQLFDHFAPRVKSFLMRSGLPDSVAEEVAQEVMITVWNKATTFDPGRAGVSTWVFTIARNQGIDHLRRTRARTTDLPFEPEDEADPAPSGELVAITTERELSVRAALANLPPEQATIVRLSFFAEKPHAQIASELGIPLGTVKSRVRLALNRLRLEMDSDT